MNAAKFRITSTSNHDDQIQLSYTLILNYTKKKRNDNGNFQNCIWYFFSEVVWNNGNTRL